MEGHVAYTPALAWRRFSRLAIAAVAAPAAAPRHRRRCGAPVGQEPLAVGWIAGFDDEIEISPLLPVVQIELIP